MTVHVGVDLAWGERARTGIAVADGDGRLLASTSVVTDDDVAAFLLPYDDGGALVAAIDAPLIVTNATGRRECEALAQQRFGRYNAGPYPSNLSRPWFAAGSRGQRLADRFGWSLDPDAPGGRRAIEVYPHPALVALLGLDRVLPYKGKGRRTIEVRLAAFARLLDGLESLPALDLAAHPRWEALRSAAATATRPFQLDAIEDEVDGILCAHLAWLWATFGRDRMLVLGDWSAGAIVTPALGPSAYSR